MMNSTYRQLVAVVVALVVGAGAFLYASPAEACSIACPAGATTPADGTTVRKGPEALFWRTPDPGSISKTDVRLGFRAKGSSQERDLLVNVKKVADDVLRIKPMQIGFSELSEGHYTFEGENCSGQNAIKAEFDVSGSSTAPPNSLGTLKKTDQQVGPLKVENGASCQNEIQAAWAKFEVELSQEAKPYADAIRYETVVDAKPWTPRERVGQMPPPGASWKGRGVDVVYAACSSAQTAENLPPGRHKVYMRAWVPGKSQPLTTNKVTVNLQCGGSEPGMDVGTDVGPSADTGGDVGVADTTPVPDTGDDTGSQPGPDTGSDVGTDTAPDSGGDTAPAPDVADAGARDSGEESDNGGNGGGNAPNPSEGGCSLSGDPRPGPLSVLVVLASMGLVGRRRRNG